MSWLIRSYKYWKRKQGIQPESSIKKKKLGTAQYTNPSVTYAIKHLNGKQIVDFSLKLLNEERNYDFYLNHTQDAPLTISGTQFTLGEVIFDGNEIQWLGRHKHYDMVSLDINADGFWFRLYMIPNVDAEGLLEKILNRTHDKLRRSRYFYRPEVRTPSGVVGHITTRNLQGIFEKHEEVELHITPLLMVVLHNNRVYQQHFIDDIKDIRCGQHPTDSESEMQLLTFEVDDKAYAYALKNADFARRLSDATREGIDKAAMRKKKK